MIRLPLIIVGGVVAAAAAVTPAVVGLSGNLSFSHQLPVRVPAHARVAMFPTATASTDLHEPSIERREAKPRHDRNLGASESVGTPPASPQRSEREPSDDRDRARAAEPGNDRGRREVREPGDGRGSGRGDARDRDGRSASSENLLSGPEDGQGPTAGGRGGGEDG